MQQRFTPEMIAKAHAKLSDRERMLLEQQVKRLIQIRNIGELKAREVLACVGAMLSESDKT